MSNHPTHAFRNRLRTGAYENLLGVIGGNVSALTTSFQTVLSGSTTDPTDAPGSAFLIDRIKIRGVTRTSGADPAATVVDTITVRITDGTTNYDLPFACWTDAGPVSRKVDIDWQIGGQIALPSGWVMQIKADVAQVISPKITIEGEFTTDRALASGGYPTPRIGAGNTNKNMFWAGGIKLATSTVTQIAAGIPGKCIELRGLYLLAQGVNASDSLELLAGYDTGKLFSLGKFHVYGNNADGRINKGSSAIQIAVPDGMNLYGRNSNAAACVGSIAAFGTYVSGRDYIDLTGRHAYHGSGPTLSATPTTLTDTLHNSLGNPWIVNEWAGYPLRIVYGTGAGQVRTITSNTTTELTISEAWTVNPAGDSVYVIDTQHTAAPIHKTAHDVGGGGGGHTTTHTFTSNLTASGHVGWGIRMLSGVNAGLTRSISANTASDITHAAFPSPNSNGDLFLLVVGQVVQSQLVKLDKASGVAAGGGHTASQTNTTGLVASTLVGKYILMTSGINAGKMQRISANTATAITHDTFGPAPGGANSDGDKFDIVEAYGNKNHSGSKWWHTVSQASWALLIRSPFHYSYPPLANLTAGAGVLMGSFGGGVQPTAPNIGQIAVGRSGNVSDMFYNLAACPASTSDPLTEHSFLEDNLWLAVNIIATGQQLHYVVALFAPATLTLWGRIIGNRTGALTTFKGA